MTDMGLNAEQRKELVRLVEAGEAIPAEWQARLFPLGASPKRTSLRQPGICRRLPHCTT